MESKMTPTPWSYQYDDNGFYVIEAKGMPSPYITATGNEADVDGFNAEAIVTAINSTYGKGIDPSSVPELLNALKNILLDSEPLKGGEQVAIPKISLKLIKAAI